MTQKIDIEAAQGEIDQVTMSDGGTQWVLRLSDSTGLVKTAELEMRGLDQGTYLIGYGGSTERKVISDVLELSLPIADAKLIRIERA